VGLLARKFLLDVLGSSSSNTAATAIISYMHIREANDRGYDCLVPEDCVGSYFPQFQEIGLQMIKAQGGIFGWVSQSAHILAAIR